MSLEDSRVDERPRQIRRGNAKFLVAVREKRTTYRHTWFNVRMRTRRRDISREGIPPFLVDLVPSRFVSRDQRLSSLCVVIDAEVSRLAPQSAVELQLVSWHTPLHTQRGWLRNNVLWTGARCLYREKEWGESYAMKFVIYSNLYVRCINGMFR